MALPTLFIVALGVSRIAYPYDVGEYEANAWAPASLLAHLHNPYSTAIATHAPFTAAPYGPSYYALVGVGVRLFGDQFWFTRICSLAAALLAAYMLYCLAYRFSRDRFAALLGSGLLLAQYPLMSWAGVQRPDVLALLAAFAGLSLGLRLPTSRRHSSYPAWSALALLMAALTRQTYVIPIAVVGAWYLLHRDHRAFATFAAVIFGAGGVLVGVLEATSHGGLWNSLVASQTKAPSEGALLSSHLRALAEAPVTWLTAALLALIASASIHKRLGPNPGVPAQHRRMVAALLSGYLVLATVLALLAGSRVGSNINYFVEPFAVASLLIGVAGAPSLHLTTSRRRVLTVALLCAGAAVTTAREGHGELQRWQARHYFAQIVATLRHVPPTAGPMFSTYPELVQDSGHVTYVNDFVQYDGRSPALKRSFDALVASHELAAIVTSAGTPPQGYVAVDVGPLPSYSYLVHLFVRRDVARGL